MSATMKIWVTATALCCAAPVWADRDHGVEIPVEISLDSIPVCYDFGCRQRARVSLSAREWRSVSIRFEPAAATPQQEREQIKQAIGWLEVLIGRHTPTHRDLAFNLPSGDDSAELFPGQQDCIDEAVNTTVYLRMLEQHGLLRHHTVTKQAYRRAIFDQHWAGQIRERVSGERYVVDSWFQPNGHLPSIQASREWEDIGLLTALSNSAEPPVSTAPPDRSSGGASTAETSPEGQAR